MAEGSISEVIQIRHSAELGGECVIDGSVVEALQEIAGEDEPEFLVEVIDLFLDDSGARVGDLRQAAAQGDGPAAARIAHALKSASANIGAVTLSWVCGDIESSVRDELEFDLEDHAVRVAKMFDEVEQVLSSLKSFVQARMG